MEYLSDCLGVSNTRGICGCKEVESFRILSRTSLGKESKGLASVRLYKFPATTVKEEIGQKAELKFFLVMTLVFFVIPLLVIQIPGVESIGKSILQPFESIINSRG